MLGLEKIDRSRERARRPQGDIALARAAQRAGIPFIMSTASNVSLERLAAEAGGDLWFQLYVPLPLRYTPRVVLDAVRRWTS